ncbi:MAG: phosphoribosylformylglycinamidine cyclo-ligase, partial [Hyphomicrobiales bacterium]|nr:phosphoribosylformylglycinamidine cyclo-ligase [Hyphomicrobiales bacterium]
VFSWLAKEGDIAPLEMLRTFNCGIGMIAVVSANDAGQVESALQKQGEQVHRIGELTAREADAVTYRGTLAL